MRSLVFTLAMLAPGVAAAQWHYQGEDSAFGEGGLHIAAVANQLYFFGVRCELGQMEAVYATPEDVDDSDTLTLQMLSPEFLLRVDDNEPIEALAVLDSMNGKLRATTEVEYAFADQLRNATRRLAIAIRLGGERFHEQTFSVVGSTRTVDDMMAGCGVEASATN
jgi:hypothetical protein